MKTSFILTNPRFPKTLEEFISQGDGYIYGQIQIVKCSVKKYYLPLKEKMI